MFNSIISVENLVKDWAPLVWLAPNEKFMPGDVTEFLQHVHAERAKVIPETNEQEIADEEQLLYYDTDNELSTILAQEQNQWDRRHKRMYKDNNYIINYIINLPVGEHSSNWNLVTNDDIGRCFILFIP